MLIFINIVGSLPNSFSEINTLLFNNVSYLSSITVFSKVLLFYILVIGLIVVFQDAYKKIDIISAKQLSGDQNQQLATFKNSYIPLKINQGGIMPLVFSSTIAIFFAYPIQLLLTSTLGLNSDVVGSLLRSYSTILNIVLVIFFSCFYAALVLKPQDISQNLAKMAYSVPGIRQGKETTKYLEKTIARLAFLGGLFLAFLTFFPLIINNFIQVNIFKNVTSLLILIGVITDVTSQVRGYLVARKYDGL
jgi:preprotein translocase subunit SecY